MKEFVVQRKCVLLQEACEVLVCFSGEVRRGHNICLKISPAACGFLYFSEVVLSVER